jgi:serine/threonine-protein kinase
MTNIDPWLGSLLRGRYRLLQKVADGRRGALYRAERSDSTEHVAVKLVHALPHQTQARFEQAFAQEMELARALADANTLLVHEYGHADEVLMFNACEWLRGVDLARLLSLRGPLSARQALYLADQALRSLGAAHARGVVHGDLTPESLFAARGPAGRSIVKVMDYGRRRLSTFSDEGLSMLRMPSGWARYLAPEQITSDDFDQRVDLYALGCILYEALSGERPFGDETGIGILMAQVDRKPKPLRAHATASALPEELEALVMRCLEKDPAARYQSADELLMQVDQLLHGAHAVAPV